MQAFVEHGYEVFGGSFVFEDELDFIQTESHELIAQYAVEREGLVERVIAISRVGVYLDGLEEAFFLVEAQRFDRSAVHFGHLPYGHASEAGNPFDEIEVLWVMEFHAMRGGVLGGLVVRVRHALPLCALIPVGLFRMYDKAKAIPWGGVKWARRRFGAEIPGGSEVASPPKALPFSALRRGVAFDVRMKVVAI